MLKTFFFILSSDLFFSLPAEELSKLVVTEICEDSYMTDNDVNEVISSEEDFDYQSIIGTFLCLCLGGQLSLIIFVLIMIISPNSTQT